MTSLWIQVIHYPIVNAFIRLKLHVAAYSCYHAAVMSKTSYYCNLHAFQ